MEMDPIEILFANTWRRFTSRFWTLAWIFLAPAVLVVLGALLAEKSVSAGGSLGAQPNFAIYESAAANPTPAAVWGSALFLFGAVLSVIAMVAMINALAHGTGVASSLRVGLRLFPKAIWVSALSVVAIVGGLILAVIPGIVLGISLVFVNYALVVEDLHGLDALRRSRFYAAGRWWEIVSRIAVTAVVFFGGIFLIYSPVLILFGRAIGAVAYLVVLVVFTAWGVSYSYEMYANLRRLGALPKAPQRAGALQASGALQGSEKAEAPDGSKTDALLKTCLIAGAVAVVLFFVLSAYP